MNNQTKLEFRLVPTKGVAFGCGAFRNDLKVVAAAAKKVVVEYRHAFRAIEFAVYCRPGDTANYDAFVSASNYMVVQAEIRCRRHQKEDFQALCVLRLSLMTDGVPHAELDILDYVFNTYAERNSWSLSRLTHAEYSWQSAREADPIENGDCVMPIADISLDARRVASRRAAIKALGLA